MLCDGMTHIHGMTEWRTSHMDTPMESWFLSVWRSCFHASMGWTVPTNYVFQRTSCADSLFRPSKFKSWLTHSPQVLLPLPLLFTPITSNSLQEDTQSSFLLRFKCLYHFSCPCVCTILGIPQKSKWRRNVTKFLFKLQIGPFYKIAEIKHFISNGLATDGVQSLNFDGDLPEIPVYNLIQICVGGTHRGPPKDRQLSWKIYDSKYARNGLLGGEIIK